MSARLVEWLVEVGFLVPGLDGVLFHKLGAIEGIVLVAAVVWGFGRAVGSATPPPAAGPP